MSFLVDYRTLFFLLVDYGSLITRVHADHKYKQLKVDVNGYLDVAPVHVVNPGFFCCHIVQNAQDFKILTEELNDFYRKQPYTGAKLMEDLPVVALFDGRC